MKIKVNSSFYIILLLVVVSFVYNKINDSSVSSNKPSKSKYVNKSQPAQSGIGNITTYGQMPTQDSWPSLSDGQQMAQNLLAQNYYIVFDGSGSMSKKGCSGGKEKIAVAREAMDTFAGGIPVEANVGLFIFDGRGASERIPLSTFHKGKFMQQITHSHAGGKTPLKTAVKAGYEALSKQAAAQLGYGEYHLVIVTDGAASKGQDPLKEVKNILVGSPVIIHTIGFCIGGNHSLNQAGLIEYKAANDPQSLVAGLEAVLAEAPDFNTNSFSGK